MTARRYPIAVKQFGLCEIHKADCNQSEIDWLEFLLRLHYKGTYCSGLVEGLQLREKHLRLSGTPWEYRGRYRNGDISLSFSAFLRCKMGLSNFTYCKQKEKV